MWKFWSSIFSTFLIVDSADSNQKRQKSCTTNGLSLWTGKIGDICCYLLETLREWFSQCRLSSHSRTKLKLELNPISTDPYNEIATGLPSECLPMPTITRTPRHDHSLSSRIVFNPNEGKVFKVFFLQNLPVNPSFQTPVITLNTC